MTDEDKSKQQLLEEKERLLAAEREQRLLVETLAEVTLVLTSHLSHEAVLDEILRQVQRVVPYSTASITLLSGDRLQVARWQGYEAFGCAGFVANLEQTLAEVPLDAEVVASQEPLLVADTHQYPGWVAIPETAWIRSYVSVPLCLRDRVLGLLRLDSDRAGWFSTQDIQRLQPLARAAAVALDNAQLYQQARQELTERKQAETELTKRNRQLLALQYAGAAIASSLDLRHVLNRVTLEMVSLLGIETCAISEWDQTTDTVSVMADYTTRTAKNRSEMEIYPLVDFPLTRQVLVERKAQQMMVSQPGIDPAERAFMEANGIKTLLMLPMEFQDRVVGLVEMMDCQLECSFTPEEIGLIQFLANQAASAIENARLYDQTRQELAERLEIEEELRWSERRNRALLDAIPDLMFRMTRAGQYLDCQGGQHGDFWVSEQHIGKNVTEVMPADVARLILDHVEKTLESRSIQVFEYSLSVMHRIQNFETRLVVSGPDEVLGIIRNITERKRAEQQLIHSERMAALGRLAAAMAHEINNPLQAMQGHLDLLLYFSLPEAEKEEHLNVIRQEIERLKNITRHVLSFARPQHRPARRVSVIELVEHVLALTGKKMEQNGIRVITSFQDVPSLLAVPEQLTQVFLNLVINAIESIGKDGWIHVSVYRDEDQVAVSFMNSGPTIPPDDLSCLFEPFFTTKSDGNGLGLWLSHSLMQQHSGSLVVENLGQERGVVFTVTLPAAP